MNKTKMTKNVDNIIIVSGLPRSGTSMMMQMLHNAGLAVLSDDERKKDDSNPKGYFEYEKVKLLAQHNDWLHLAQGKALKVIAQLIPFLPPHYTYKIIFMERDIHEILNSQQKMLGKPITSIPFGLAETFTNQLKQTKQFISTQSNMEMLTVNYTDVIEYTDAQINRIIPFLNLSLDAIEMQNVVDANLYRNKTASKFK